MATDFGKPSRIFLPFTEDFVNTTLKNESLPQSPLFKVGGNHIFFPNEESLKLLQGVVENMFREISSEYANKYDLLRSYVQIIMHEAMKIQPPETFYQPANASERISTLFLELLERQFPIDAPSQTLKLKTANEFAAAQCTYQYTKQGFERKYRQNHYGMDCRKNG